MDVRCERCDTEYELDDDAIPPGGCPVQCTTCGHTFTVAKTGMPQAAAPPAELSPAPTTAEWLLETGDGKLHRFRNLTSLQKWIIERKVTREDKISRTGHAWRRLGEIVELGPFFDVVDEADRAKAAVAAADDPLKNEAARARRSMARSSARPAPPPEPTPDPNDTLDGRPGPNDDSDDEDEDEDEDEQIESPPPRRQIRAAARPKTARRDFDDELSPNPSMVTSVVRVRSSGGSAILKFGAVVLIASAVAVGTIFVTRQKPQTTPTETIPPPETAPPPAQPAPAETQHAPPPPAEPTPPPVEQPAAKPEETVPLPTPVPARTDRSTPTPTTETKATAVATDPSASYENLLEQADRLLENGNTERAFKLYERAIKMQPQGIEALVGLGYVMLDKGRNAPAIGYFKKALAGAPSFGPAWFGLAEAARNAGDTPEAMRSYKRYLEINPNSQYSSAARRQLQLLQDVAAKATSGPADPP